MSEKIDRILFFPLRRILVRIPVPGFLIALLWTIPAPSLAAEPNAVPASSHRLISSLSPRLHASGSSPGHTDASPKSASNHLYEVPRLDNTSPGPTPPPA